MSRIVRFNIVILSVFCLLAMSVSTIALLSSPIYAQETECAKCKKRCDVKYDEHMKDRCGCFKEGSEAYVLCQHHADRDKDVCYTMCETDYSDCFDNSGGSGGGWWDWDWFYRYIYAI